MAITFTEDTTIDRIILQGRSISIRKRTTTTRAETKNVTETVVEMDMSTDPPTETSTEVTKEVTEETVAGSTYNDINLTDQGDGGYRQDVDASVLVEGSQDYSAISAPFFAALETLPEKPPPPPEPDPAPPPA